MKFYVGVTDTSWFSFLSSINPEDVNFWQPGGNTPFKVIDAGSPFLFKLKSPLNVIGGLGFLSSHTFLPISIAWETFRQNNGTRDFQSFLKLIQNYRHDHNENPNIGCIILTNPIFFKEDDWIQIPENWKNSIVQGKSYSTEEPIGNNLWNKVLNTLPKYHFFDKNEGEISQLVLEPEARYGQSFLRNVRLGQGAFRVLVTDAYTRRCAISGEKTLPVLEAAHIKPYSESGPHFISNSLLLRSDLHKLFDSGYLTITTEYKVEVSQRIKQEFENGKDYYKFHGADLSVLPHRIIDQPSKEFVSWHNELIYKG